MRKRIFILALGCLLLTTATVQAQADTVQRNKMRHLHFMAGRWEVETDARLSMNGPWEKSKGTAHIRLRLDSALLEEDYEGTRQGAAFRSKTFFAVTNTHHKYQRFFIDAPHGVVIDFEGEREEEVLVFDKLHVYANGNTVKLRVVYKRISDDEFRLESMRMPQGTTSWDTTGRMRYRRVEKK